MSTINGVVQLKRIGSYTYFIFNKSIILLIVVSISDQCTEIKSGLEIILILTNVFNEKLRNIVVAMFEVTDIIDGGNDCIYVEMYR
jgi:hypothetical protein